MVEVTNGPRTQLTTSCTYPVAEGIAVQTDTEEVQEARRFVMDLLLSGARMFRPCRSWPRSWALAEPSYPKGESDCILCGKCVRMCHEVQHASAIAMMGRGADREVLTPFGELSTTCRTCGACLFVCPTGHINDLAAISGKTPKPKFSEFNAKLVSQGNLPVSIRRRCPRPPPSTPRTASNCSPATAASAPKSVPPAPLITSKKDETVQLDVGAVILAPGFKTFDPTGIGTYGYGKYPDVYTSLEFERILSPAAPYAGHVVRRSDHKEPQRIAWLHCVGIAATGKASIRTAPDFCAWPP